MRRKRVYIDDGLDVALERLAEPRECPAAPIRAALRSYVGANPVSSLGRRSVRGPVSLRPA